MKQLRSFSKFVFDKHIYVLVSFAVLFSAFLCLDYFLKIVDLLDVSFQYVLAKKLGSIGIIVVITGFLFSPCRYIYIVLQKRFAALRIVFLRDILYVAGNFHPFLELAGFLLLGIHGYIFLSGVYNDYIDLIALSGFAALLFFLSSVITGFILKKDKTLKKNRTVHRAVVMLFIVAYIVHRVVMA